MKPTMQLKATRQQAWFTACGVTLDHFDLKVHVVLTIARGEAPRLAALTSPSALLRETVLAAALFGIYFLFICHEHKRSPPGDAHWTLVQGAAVLCVRFGSNASFLPPAAMSALPPDPDPSRFETAADILALHPLADRSGR